MGGDAYLSWCMVDGAPWPTRPAVRFEGLRWGLGVGHVWVEPNRVRGKDGGGRNGFRKNV
jgi:hypothetical protein